jgi:hypothetical protein
MTTLGMLFFCSSQRMETSKKESNKMFAVAVKALEAVAAGAKKLHQ